MSSPLEPAPAAFELAAPDCWRCVDFISDLHLQASEPAVVQAWQHYLLATPADAVFMLGDLFEVWVGDDAARQPDSFEAQGGKILRAAAARCALHFMRGNRDFLVGAAFLEHCQVRDLPDPTVLGFAGQRWLLSHGDALCLDDTAYQQFRRLVRNTAWQADFLARPLAERTAQAARMRAHSEEHKHADHYVLAEVDPPAAIRWLQTARAGTLIHGHTHRPADHVLDAAARPPLRRVVLSDWHEDADGLRAEVLRLHADGRLQRLAPATAAA